MVQSPSPGQSKPWRPRCLPHKRHSIPLSLASRLWETLCGLKRFPTACIEKQINWWLLFFSQIQFETISFTISFIGPRGPAVMQNASVIFVHASQEHQRSQAVHAWGNVEDTFSAQNMFACMHAGWDIHRFKFPWTQNYQIYDDFLNEIYMCMHVHLVYHLHHPFELKRRS